MTLSALLTLVLLAPATPAGPPKVRPAPGDFIPQGYRIESEVQGDLNGDGREDRSLELIQEGPAEDAEGAPLERDRRWLVLLAVPEGGWRQVADARHVLFCATCGGAKSTTLDREAASISKGVVLIKQFRGSRETVESLLRFRYAPKADRMQLIGMDIAGSDSLAGTTVRHSTNLLTGRKRVDRLRWDEAKQREVKVSTKQLKVPPRVVYAEDVDLDKLEESP